MSCFESSNELHHRKPFKSWSKTKRKSFALWLWIFRITEESNCATGRRSWEKSKADAPTILPLLLATLLNLSPIIVRLVLLVRIVLPVLDLALAPVMTPRLARGRRRQLQFTIRVTEIDARLCPILTTTSIASIAVSTATLLTDVPCWQKWNATSAAVRATRPNVASPFRGTSSPLIDFLI